MNVPKLRFPGFEEEWRTWTLGEIATVRTGKAFSSNDFSESGEYLVVTNKNILDQERKIKSIGDRININDNKILDNYLLDGDNILVTMDGAKIGSTGRFTNNKAVLAQRVGRLNSDQIDFIYQITKSKKFVVEMNKISVGNAIKHISLDQISNYTFFAPSNDEEQAKMGGFFRNIDTEIQLLQEKINLLKEQKKGFMQKIFSQELRFKDENGQEFPKWEQNVKALDLFESISNKNHAGNYPVLSATQDQGMVYRDSLERNMSFDEGNLNTYKLVESGDFVISLRSFQGGIEFSNLEGLVSPAYTVFRSISPKVNAQYFAKLFKTDNFIQRLNSTTYGIRDGKAISFNDFSSLKFSLPSIKEQEKIASFLDILEKKIIAETAKLKQLEFKKQYFMQQMFV